jgi:outer membrane protein OmpA-like peptidoglycan-associated protein
MSDSIKRISAAMAVLLLAAPPAYAIDDPAMISKIDQSLGVSDPDTPSEIKQRMGVGDPVAGKEKSAFCQGCHGEDGNSVSGVFPKLAGQWSDYLQKQIREFQNGARVNETMTDMATSISEFQDLYDIAAYFASQKQMVGTPVEDEAEKKLYLEGEKLYTEGNPETGQFRCVKCHGIHGSGQPLNNNLFPVLGGQHKEYLIKQLTEFKHEVRENDRSGMMLRITTHLTAHQIEALATYLSRFPAVEEAAAAPVASPPPLAPTPAAVSAVVATAPAAPVPETWKTLLEEKPVQVQGTNFKFDSRKLKAKNVRELDEVAAFLKQYPDIKVKVVGYTDSTGQDRHNRKLSAARAETVRNYLIKKGIAPQMIIAVGEGSANPVGDNKTSAGRAQNRRVEIHLLVREEKKVPIKN